MSNFLTTTYFEDLRKIIYQETGIVFEDKKRYFLENKIAEHMRELSISSLKDYLLQLRLNKKVLRDLITKVTVNETYFYRDFYQLEAFAELLQKVSDSRKLRIISIPCSTGEEPYTLAIVCREILNSVENISIYGVDIDYKALEKAREGIYSDRSVSKLPHEYKRRYFKNKGKDKWMISDEIKEMVRFFEGSILDLKFLKSLGIFFFIFCKNLLIYFDLNSRRRAVNNLYEILEDTGYLFLGPSESLSRISSLFRPVKVKEAIVYQKELEEEE